MSIDIGGALSLIGGSPILKVGTVFMEKLKAAKSLDGGGLGSLLSGLLGSTGLASMMQNPVAALTNGLQSELSSALSSLTSFGGAASTIAALAGSDGLGAVVSSFAQTASALAGTGAIPLGGFGLMDIITHANTVDVLGANPPYAYTVATAAMPLTSSSLLTTVTTQVNAVAAAVVAGTMTDADAATQIIALTSSLQAVITASNNAISGLRAVLPTLATASAVGAALAQATSVAPGDATLAALLPTLVQPSALTVLKASAAAMIAAEDVVMSEVAPLINAENVTIASLMAASQ